MTTWLLVWPAVAYAVALVLGRMLRGADELPSPVLTRLSDEAVDARFAEIVAHFRVLS